MIKWIRKIFGLEGEKPPARPEPPRSFEPIPGLSLKNYGNKDVARASRSATRRDQSQSQKVASLSSQLIILEESSLALKINNERLVSENTELKDRIKKITLPRLVSVTRSDSEPETLDRLTQRKVIKEMNTDIKVRIDIKGMGTVPLKYNESDAGYHIHASEPCVILKGSRGCIPTGIIIEDIPEGYVGKVYAPNSMTVRKGLFLINEIIDSSFKGELKLVYYNCSNEDQKFDIHSCAGKLLFTEKAKTVEWQREGE